MTRNAHLGRIRPGCKVHWTDYAGKFTGRVLAVAYHAPSSTYLASVRILPLTTHRHVRTVPLHVLTLT